MKYQITFEQLSNLHHTLAAAQGTFSGLCKIDEYKRMREILEDQIRDIKAVLEETSIAELRKNEK